ncbi:MAG: helix-turn-helix domain-containing protein [Sporocytophaga sp.]|uniref:helix-turn-helix domain-containing protein n=1 Tax=Sporocytophaga sp. TaxID=2231183 RepID=UPI001B2F5AD7|nr:helix-turn-helix domain-containing protein [Sporocytophaga sp.]MBO9699253.1 helix-turn-helix domain-containing protein [Sporocytophaga sp.]
MPKYKKKTVDQICSLLSTGLYTIESICNQVGIHPDTFYDWQRNKPEFANLVEEARAERISSLREIALSSLVKGLTGFNYDEVTSKNGKVVRTVTKFVAPNPNLIMFTLKNTAPEQFNKMAPVGDTPIQLPPVREIEDAPDKPDGSNRD